MSRRLKGMLIGLLLIGGAFLLFNNHKYVNLYGTPEVNKADESSPISDHKNPIFVGNTKFNDFRSGQRLEVISFWVTLYDHLDTFLKKYDTPTCHTTWDACYEMYNVELFTVSGKQIEALSQDWENILGATTPYLIGDTSNQIEQVRDRFDPILREIQRLTRTNYGLINVKEYHQEVIPLLRGMQYRIKYSLVDYFVADRQLLPWKISLTQDDSPH